MKKIIPQKKTKPGKKISRPKTKKQEPTALPQFGLHTLKAPAGSHKRKKILGRGSSSGHGKTSTRGSKGQTSRSGRDFYPGFEGGQTPLIRRIPKRGFTNRFKKEFQLVNLRDLNTIKESTINPVLLEERGLIKNKAKLVKILGDGQIEKAVAVQAHAFSKHAAEAIEKAGGKIEIISPYHENDDIQKGILRGK
jgi:large subunit ribosomal protein L15